MRRRHQFRSPQHKLVNFFQRSRDQWRDRATAYQEELRELKVRVRDVELSRDHWRAKYFERRGAGAANPAGQAVEPAGAEPPLPGIKHRRRAPTGSGPH